MLKFQNRIKLIFLALLAVIFVLNLTSLYSLISYAETDKTELSQNDKDLLKYYHEPTIDENFEDNKVWVIFKSAYDYLDKVSLKDFEVVESVTKIYSIRYNLRDISSYNESLDLIDMQNHMFKITLETHSKDKVLVVCNLLNELDKVLVATPEYIYETVEASASDDEYYTYQWGLNGTYGINIEQAWDITRGSLGVKVGIMEDNIDMNHQDLSGRVFIGNLTPSADAYADHGTHVAGIIGAKQDENGIAGIAQCSMYLLDNNKDNFADSIAFANENDIKIINASFHYSYIINDYGTTVYDSYNVQHYNALKNYNGLFIAAAANNNNDNDSTSPYPASYDLPNVISVGAINLEGVRWVKSNYGQKSVDLFAPGGFICSTLPNDTYGTNNGTSMAAPHVAGVAALIYAKYPFLSASEAKDAIVNNVRKLDNLEEYCVSGGILDAYAALANAHKHIEAYHFINENEHEVYCDVCTKFLRIEQHNWQARTSNTRVAVLPESWICKGCRCIRHRNGDYEIVYKEEDKYA